MSVASVGGVARSTVSPEGQVAVVIGGGDACLIAMDYGRESIIKADWKNIFRDDELDKNLARMLHLEKIKRSHIERGETPMTRLEGKTARARRTTSRGSWSTWRATTGRSRRGRCSRSTAE